MTAAVQVESLTKHFGNDAAVSDVGFEIAEGEFFTLLGPSGCGKTTTLRCVAGLESADAGRIRLAGEVVFDAATGIDRPADKRRIGMVFQSYAVWPHMTVAENIVYPLKIRGRPRAEIAARLEEVLSILDMDGLGTRMPAQLSGGQQQRVALGRALAVEPRVLLLDEPLSNLDAKLREQMRAELKLLQRQARVPILYVTHDQVEALAMSDRIAVMNAGRIHHLAPPVEIYERPRTRFVLDFIGSVSYLPCRIGALEDGFLTLELPAGRLYLPSPETLPDHDAASLAVRPEDVRLARADTVDDSAATGRVVLRAFVGDGFEYRISVGDEMLRARTDKTAAFEEGERVALSFVKGVLVPQGASADSKMEVVEPVSVPTPISGRHASGGRAPF